MAFTVFLIGLLTFGGILDSEVYLFFLLMLLLNYNNRRHVLHGDLSLDFLELKLILIIRLKVLVSLKFPKSIYW